MEHPEVEVFPESDTFGVMIGGAPGAEVEFAKYFRGESAFPFWEEQLEPRDE
jgi:hypothetical protein